MPREKVERVIEEPSDANGHMRRYEREVKERENKKIALYSVPATWEALLALLNGASADEASANALVDKLLAPDPERRTSKESARDALLRMFNSSVERLATASVYQSLAQETTIISVGTQKMDLKTFPVGRLVNAINQTRGKRDTDLLMIGIEDPDSDDVEVMKKVAAIDRKINYRQMEAAARWLVEEMKVASDSGDTLKLNDGVDPKSKLVEATAA